MPRLFESTVSLRLHAEDLDPTEIDQKLGYIAEFSYRKGDVFGRVSGQRIRKGGMWLVEATERAPADLNAQITEILQKLTDDLSVWQELTTRFSADIFCGLFMNEGNEGISISPEVMKMISERGLLIDFDLYAPVGEPD